MYVWLGLWAIVAVVEALLYAFGSRYYRNSLYGRLLFAGIVGAGLVAVDIGMLIYDWRCWVLVILLSPYRIINLARFVKSRLQEHRLQSVSLRTHGWLLSTQMMFFAICLVLLSVSGVSLLIILSFVQLVGVLVLLRASMRTWEHAKPISIENHLTDRDLPSVSVLVPARDETDELRACLDGLVANDYPKLEILVLDDCSISKKTPEIIRSYAQAGVRFVKGEVPPENWIAKNYAYEQLRLEASGEYFVYCGVDTLFETKTIRTMVETMLDRQKEMMSVLPTRSPQGENVVSFLQTMRYYWELCLPRRMFKRPPVLSTCWVVKSSLLEQLGGFKAVSQSVSPEAHFAKLAVANDMYTFVRSHAELQVHSTKSLRDQYDTTVRLRYPQLHRRLELVAATTLFELVFFVGPFLGLPLSLLLPHSSMFFAIWFAAVLVVEVMYYLISVQTKLNSPLVAFATAPFGFAADILMLHVSMLRYEFGTVNWKGRNICIPVMRVEPRLPKLPS